MNNGIATSNFYSMSNSNADFATTMALFMNGLSLANEYTSWGYRGYTVDWNIVPFHTWMHLAFVRDSVNKRYNVYVDGNLHEFVDSTVSENGTALSVEGFTIG